MPITSVVSIAARTWREAQAELTPAKSFERINDNAKFLAGSISLVGTVLTAVGLLSIDRLRVNVIAASLATLAVILVIAAVMVGVISLVLHTKTVQIGNLDDVKQWYHDQLGRARILAAAGWALVAAILIGGIAAGLVIFATSSKPSLSLQVVGQGQDSKLNAKVTAQDLAPGTEVNASVLGYDTLAQSAVIGQATTTADATGKVDLSIEIAKPGSYQHFRLRVLISGRAEPFTVDLARP